MSFLPKILGRNQDFAMGSAWEGDSLFKMPGENFFGEVLKPEFTLSDALAAKALVPYEYHPIL